MNANKNSDDNNKNKHNKYKKISYYLAGIIATLLFLSGLLYAIPIYSKNLPKHSYSIIEAVLLLIFGILIIKLVQELFVKIIHNYISEDRLGFLKFILNFTAYFTLFLLIFSSLGIDISNILLGATFLGVIFGIASQTVLSNLLSGFTILFAKPFKIGDRITIVTWQYGLLMSTYQHEAVKPGYTGVIKDINILFTTIKEDNGFIMKAPNNILMQALVTNYANTNKRLVRVRFELDKVIDFENFKKDLNVYLLTKKDIIEQNPLPIIRIIDLSLTSYFVAVEVFTPSIFEDPVRDAVLSYVLIRQSEILSKPLLK
ncbi:MAG: mechanosensitive ion channel family protein [Candidatus Acididesulfobacter guangdongensis]|uniref:Mechanosensitive ion channel family protein n=1 Tax=Acididesulfobacter guangdongensis TaxID=2597225 RepID=A0A519BEU6_ACIG2|nr:MAG: mechanosensitive ion channel family protein [Candidatus Acididesulfobacter guangdongensis]